MAKYGNKHMNVVNQLLNTMYRAKLWKLVLTIYFEPDDSIFQNIDFKYDILSKRLRELAFKPWCNY